MNHSTPKQAVGRFRRIVTQRVLAAFAVVVALVFLVENATSAEIQIRSRSVDVQNVVRLADVAVVLDSDQERTRRLGEIPLFAAPRPGESTTLDAREIRDILQTRGVNLLEHRLSGASQVVVSRGDQEAAKPQRQKSEPSAAQLAEQIQVSIVAYLRQHAEDTDRWLVEFDLDRVQKQELATAESPLTIRGGLAPWVGEQQFTVEFSASGKRREISLNTNVTLPQLQVVAVRPLRKGQIVRQDDLILQAPLSQVAARRQVKQVGYTSLDEVVGMEVEKATSPGQVLAPGSVRRPVLVRRGDVVTVYARAAGIEVRSVGRAKDDGAENDLIVVESMDRERAQLRARVSGVRTVDVLAEGSFVPNGSAKNKRKRRAAR